jgi:hypothetical protein
VTVTSAGTPLASADSAPSAPRSQTPLAVSFGWSSLSLEAASTVRSCESRSYTALAVTLSTTFTAFSVTGTSPTFATFTVAGGVAPS